MRLTENTKVRIKVPKHLYESIKEELEGKYEMEEALRAGVYDDFAKWKESFPEGTEFKQQNGYMLAKDDEDKELGKWNPVSQKGMHSDDFQYKSLEEKGQYKMEDKVNEVLPGYVGMSPDQVELMDTLGKLIMSGALVGSALAAGKTLLSFLKSKKADSAPVTQEPAEMEEAIDFQTLMEAVKDAAKKKKEAKAKEKAAKEKEAEEAKKKKEAEAKKKAVAAKKK
jgi:hypothetical protein